jgi:glycosyltransferase involved in cell wall biosynthesis
VNGRRLIGPRTGVARYASSILAAWAEHRPPGIAQIDVHAPGLLAEEPRAPHVAYIDESSRRPHLVWENTTFRRRTKRCDVIFSPTNTLPLMRGGPAGVLVRFDTLAVERPQDFGIANRLRNPLEQRSIRRAEAIITISETSLQGIVRCFGVDAGAITVIPPGVDAQLFRPRSAPERAAMLTRLGLDDRSYVLFVGKFSARRNVPTLIDAVGRLRQLGHVQRFVLVGPNHLGLPLEQLASDAGADVLHLEGIDDETLAMLYSGATLFVQAPSFEPFSLPLLEAMASGTPCVTVEGGGPSEIGGDAVAYIDEPDADKLAKAMAGLLDDEVERARLANAARERALTFSWDTLASQIAEILGDVASKRN